MVFVVGAVASMDRFLTTTARPEDVVVVVSERVSTEDAAPIVAKY